MSDLKAMARQAARDHVNASLVESLIDRAIIHTIAELEHFRVSNRSWVSYDEQLKLQRGKLLPLRAELHEIHERQSEK